jgi:hypothetical protein
MMFGDAKDAMHAHFRVPVHIHTLPKADPPVALAMTNNHAYCVSDTGSLYRWTVNDINLETEQILEPFHAIKGANRLDPCKAHF